MRGCLITGTGTGVGKTILSASLAASLVAQGRHVGAYKPVVTGIAEPSPGWPHDHELLAGITGQTPESVCGTCFQPPMSPHLAAGLAGTELDPPALVAGARRLGSEFETLIVEGVGGLLVPLTLDYTIRDLARDIALPVLIAASPGLGTINHTLLTLESARAAGLDVRAVVLTPWPEQPTPTELSNRETISAMGEVQVALLPEVPRPDRELLARAGRVVAEAIFRPDRYIASGR